MEQHPIPQNVTSFEFHLVGDMTLKQFGYLAGGLTVAYLTFVFLLPISAPLAIPIIAVSAFLGMAFAFLPIADRPLDHWLVAFSKAIALPTQGQHILEEPILRNRLQIYLHSLTPLAQPPIPLPQVEKVPPAPPTPQKIEQSPPQMANVPSDEQLRKTVGLAQQSQIIQAKILEAEKYIGEVEKTVLSPVVDPHAYAKQLQIAQVNLQNLIKKAQQLSLQIAKASLPLPGQVVAPLKKAEVKVIATPPPESTQLLLTSLPNVINGVIVDLDGNYLEGVVVVIHNQDNLPVRASKTNKLGQFAGATPLPSGTYSVTLEKEGFEFDVLQITLKGELLPPLQIQAKRSLG